MGKLLIIRLWYTSHDLQDVQTKSHFKIDSNSSSLNQPNSLVHDFVSLASISALSTALACSQLRTTYPDM